MSNSKKKVYKKRKQAPHTKEKTPRNVPEKSRSSEFLDNWLWLITLVVIVAAFALMIVLVPKCDESCTSCNESKVVDSVDLDETQEEETPAHYSAEEMRAQYPEVAQFQLPAEGEEIAVLETSMGTIRLRLFPEAAPKAVENFKGLISSGYYDGIVFHRVIDDFMIQTGDPGDGGKSIWGTEFEDELKVGLHNFRGALSMANSGANTNGSQFFIVSTYEKMNQTADGLMAYGIDETSAKVYDSFSGAYWLDGELTPVSGSGHTTFGQVIDGMDVVDAIAAVDTDENDRPYTDVVINKAYLTNYTAATPAE